MMPIEPVTKPTSSLKAISAPLAPIDTQAPRAFAAAVCVSLILASTPHPTRLVPSIHYVVAAQACVTSSRA